MPPFNLQGLSSLYDTMIEGYENDIQHNNNLMEHVYKDFKMDEEKLKQLLSCIIKLRGKNIITLWNAIHKWDLSCKDTLKSYIIDHIYRKRKYRLKVENMGTDMNYLLHGTCINNNDKCTGYKLAIERGHIECFRYFRHNRKGFITKDQTINPTVDVSNESSYASYDLKMMSHNNVCNVAAKYGHLDFLKYLLDDDEGCLNFSSHKNFKEWTLFVCENAAKNGHLLCLQYLISKGCTCDEWTCNFAAKYGELKCLQYLVENGYIWTIGTYYMAALDGQLSCLKYLHEKCVRIRHNFSDLPIFTCEYTAKNGHLECLQYLVENGCKINVGKCLETAHENCKTYLLELKANGTY
jgi:hypothetical protein